MRCAGERLSWQQRSVCCPVVVTVACFRVGSCSWRTYGGLGWLVVACHLLIRGARAEEDVTSQSSTFEAERPPCQVPSCQRGAIYCAYCMNGRFNICDKDGRKDCRCDDDNCIIKGKLFREGCTHEALCVPTTTTTTPPPDYGLIPALIVFTVPSVTCAVLASFCFIEKYCYPPQAEKSEEAQEDA
eukprot:TRINITY_DN56217_c0_g1_i1.p1 TRINITY_DN56217_c0_g1~~TRINITY_DN56217_c0_g1_i1.p1  ORF type:complete len:186 (+),score=30.28 TRINITY_DN56217_c0_g1_i1:68-625(+)